MTAQHSQPKYQIGQKYIPVGKTARFCTVTDILKTYNSKGDLVRIRYVSEHTFMGQTVVDTDICETTIARGALDGSVTDALR